MIRYTLLLGALILSFVAAPKDVKSSGLTYAQLEEQQVVMQKDEAAAKIATANWQSEQLINKAKKLVGTKQGQCVIAVRNFLGIGKDQVSGMAKNTKINSSVPAPEAIIVLKMSSVGHVGVVLAEQGDIIMYYDSNGDWRQRGAIRYINKNDPRIRGYRII